MTQSNTPDITLSNGRVIKSQPRASGGNDVIPADGGEMNNDEWNEYCNQIRHLSAERFKKFMADRIQRNREAFEIAKHQHLVGRYARSVESGWLGQVVAIERRGGDVLCKMVGVDQLHNDVAGCSLDESVADNDVQWFVPADLKFLRQAVDLVKTEIQ
jgi:hypothetical protein